MSEIQKIPIVAPVYTNATANGIETDKKSVNIWDCFIDSKGYLNRRPGYENFTETIE